MFRRLLRRLWNDDLGAVVSTEYVMVTGLVVSGVGSGMVAIRNAGIRQSEKLAASMDATLYIPTPDQLREATALPQRQAVQQPVQQVVIVNNFLPPSP